MKSTSFKDNLLAGRIHESTIGSYLRRKGWTIIPIYELEQDAGKGPQIFAPSGASLVGPDMIAYRNGATRFVEAKTKSVFSWRRTSPGPRWETGIDLRHYSHYCKVADLFPDWEFHLLFLHLSAIPWIEDRKWPNCPKECPTGLFRGRLQELRSTGRSSDRHASGMMYWGYDSLQRIATLEKVQNI